MARPPDPSNVRPLRKPEWIGGILSLPVDVKGGTPDVALLLDGTTGRVLGVEACAPGAAANGLRGLVLRELAGHGGRRASLRIGEPSVADELRDLALDVVVAPTPELEEARASLAEALAAREFDDASYLQDGRVSPWTAGRLFRAAARLYRTAPWEALPDGFATLRLEVPELGIEAGGLLVFGAPDEPPGLSIIERAEDFRAFADLSGGADARLQVPVLQLHFAAKAELPSRMRHELSRHRWECAPGATPELVSLDRDGNPRSHGDREVKLAAAAAEALVAFVEARGDELESGACLAFETRPEGLPEVRLVYPHPDVTDEIDRELGEALGDEVESRAQAFAAAARAAGRDERWCTCAIRVARSLQDRKLETGLDLEHWPDGFLRFYLLDWVPRCLPVRVEDAALVPAVLGAFFDHLRETDAVAPEEASRAKALIAGETGRFLAAAAAEGGFSPEKRLLLAAEAAGVDVQDEGAVERYFREHGERFRPAEEPARPAEVKVGRNDPCPCGSGKKHKKCCGA